MAKAYAIQGMDDLSVVDVDGAPAATMRFEAPSTDQWTKVRRAAARARRSGYGFERLDRASVCAVYYDKKGITKDTVAHGEMVKDLTASGILPPDKTATNAIVLNSIPQDETTGPHIFIPFFLYPLPKTSIIDMLCGRMAIFLITNSGRLFDKLRDAGFEVSNPSGKHDLGSRSIVIRHIGTTLKRERLLHRVSQSHVSYGRSTVRIQGH